MTRRTIGFLVILALGFRIALPTADAQRLGNIPLVGVLEPNPSTTPCFAAFQQGLRDLGYVEGQNIQFEYRYAANVVDRLPALAAELVQRTPDVIWTHSPAAALATKQAITTIPVVIGVSEGLLELGVVESLARPGGNLTGLDTQFIDHLGKRLALLKEAVPTIARVAILVDPVNPIYQAVPHNIEREARALGVQLQRVEARRPEDFEGAFVTMVQGGADALMLQGGPPFGGTHLPRLVELAHRHRLPTIGIGRQHAEAGCLLAYGAPPLDLCQRSAVFVDKILQGAKPADLPVERPRTFELVINLKAAQALGLTIPPTLLFQADEVIR
jgi:putative tryptophan/tyrosine transport system substrate-binding protein